MSDASLLSRPVADVAADITSGALPRAAALEASLQAYAACNAGPDGLNAVLYTDADGARNALADCVEEQTNAADGMPIEIGRAHV